MARKLTRSNGPSQVTPDTSIARRFEMPCAWNSVLSKAKKTRPLLGSRSQRGILDEVDIHLSLTANNPKQSAPTLMYGDGHRLYTVNKRGEDWPRRDKKGLRGASLLTITSKMTCPSFSLLAGPTTEGGTCVAANTGKKGGKRTPGKTYICDGCYSLEGAYIYPNVAISQVTRQVWVLQQLTKDPTGVLLGQQLAAALSDYAGHGTLKGSSKGMAERITQELGIWDGDKIIVPVFIPAFGERRWMPCFPTELPAQQFGVPDTRAWFKRRGVADGEVVGFFRIHDSGDLTVGNNPLLWTGYINAWIEAARLLPNVIFWCPTRLWVLPKINKQLQAQIKSVPNLIVRPSALNVMGRAPVKEGLANGTTVAWVEKTKKGEPKVFQQTHDENGEPCYNCPVYLLDSGKSCMGAGCRACWLAPELPVAYGWH